MYEVNAKTLEFNIEKMDEEERNNLKNLALKGVRGGYVDMNHPAFIVWKNTANFSNDQGLVAYSTVFLSRILVSFVDPQ